jgi:branched-chain amino acid transport system permease protein
MTDAQSERHDDGATDPSRLTLLRRYVTPRDGINFDENSSLKNAAIVGFVVFAAAFPLIVRNAYLLQIGTFFFIYGSLTISWDLIAGYQGSFSFAHAAFFGFGGYTSALVAMHLELSPWLSMPVAMLATAVIALPIAYPTIRLHGPYVAMVTLAYGEILRRIAKNMVSLTNGPIGLTGIPGLIPDGVPIDSKIAHYYVGLGLFAIVAGSVYLTLKSRFGLVIQAVRDSERGARAVGIDVAKYKLFGFVFGSSLAGLAGGFYAHYMKLMSPDQLGISNMIEIMVMGIVGGLGTFIGPIIGTALLLVSGEFLREFGPWRLFLYGIIITVVIFAAPSGLVGLRSRVHRTLGREEADTIDKEPRDK